jgi:hypothetical protein
MEQRAQPWALGIGLAGATLMLAAVGAAAKKRSRLGGGAGLSPASETPRDVYRPGDEAEPGTPQTGEGLCPACSGSGRTDGHECSTCAGTGTVIVNIGDA